MRTMIIRFMVIITLAALRKLCLAYGFDLTPGFALGALAMALVPERSENEVRR